VPEGIGEGGCVVPPPSGPGSDNDNGNVRPPAPKKPKRNAPMFERSKRLEQIISLLEEKLKQS